jgi:Uma2 family endonuclease
MEYTAEEFFRIVPESGSERFELLDGEIVGLAAPSVNHQRITKKICWEFDRFIERNSGKCETFMSPTDVKLDEQNVVQPDVFIICDPSKLDGRYCNGAPDLVVEVVSGNRTRDYVKKLNLYEKSGVKEYWIVDPAEKRIVVYIFGEVMSMNIYTFDMPVPVGIWGGKATVNINA